MYTSHAARSHAKLNHTAWPLLTYKNITVLQWQWLKNNFTSTLHILQVLHRWVHRACQAMADGKTNTETYISHVTWNPPHMCTCTQTPSRVWEKCFPFLSFLSQQKTTLTLPLPLGLFRVNKTLNYWTAEELNQGLPETNLAAWWSEMELQLGISRILNSLTASSGTIIDKSVEAI